MNPKEIRRIVDKLKKHYNTKEASIERALELPFGTLSKAQDGIFPKDKEAFFAVLKILDNFPWMVDVADHKFDRAFAFRKMGGEVIDHLAKHINERADKMAAEDLIKKTD